MVAFSPFELVRNFHQLVHRDIISGNTQNSAWAGVFLNIAVAVSGWSRKHAEIFGSGTMRIHIALFHHRRAVDAQDQIEQAARVQVGRVPNVLKITPPFTAGSRM